MASLGNIGCTWVEVTFTATNNRLRSIVVWRLGAVGLEGTADGSGNTSCCCCRPGCTDSWHCQAWDVTEYLAIRTQTARIMRSTWIRQDHDSPFSPSIATGECCRFSVSNSLVLLVSILLAIKLVLPKKDDNENYEMLARKWMPQFFVTEWTCSAFWIVADVVIVGGAWLRYCRCWQPLPAQQNKT